jgi:hypothetical protein
LGGRLGLALHIQSERVASFLDMGLCVVSFFTETSTVEARKTNINAE